MKRVVKLDRQDIKHLVRLILEEDSPQGTPSGELSDTKSELIKQATANINQMISDKDVGLVVALFILVLTDDAAQYQLLNLGSMYDKYLAGGGKEVDFTKKVTSQLRMLGQKFKDVIADHLLASKDELLEGLNQNASIDRLQFDLEEYSDELQKAKQQLKNDPELKDDPEFMKEYDSLETGIKEIKSKLKHLGVKDVSITKNQIRKLALQRIKDMSNNPKIIRVFSMFLFYLTDKDTVADLRQIGQSFGPKINRLINDESTTWVNDVVHELKTKLTPFIKRMSQSINSGDGNKPDETGFQADKDKAQEIIKKYNFQ